MPKSKNHGQFFFSLLSLLFGRICQTQIRGPSDAHRANEGNLELNGHGPEIEYLHGRPDQVIRPQGGEVDVLKLLEDGPPAATLGDSHEREKDAEADGGEDELVHSHALQSWEIAPGLGDGESAGEESEPFKLDGGHEEAVGHETGEAFEVKGSWSISRRGEERADRDGLLLQVCELDGDKGPAIAGRWCVGGREGFSPGLDSGEGLGNRVGYAAEDLGK